MDYKDVCKITGDHFASYVLTDQFVLGEDLSVYKHAEKNTDVAYMLSDPNRPSSSWMIPVAAVADCKQFKAMNSEKRKALKAGDVCFGIPIGTHLLEALTTDKPQEYKLGYKRAASQNNDDVPIVTHKRTSSEVDDHEAKKAKREQEEYDESMKKLTPLMVPPDAPVMLLDRVIEQLRKPPTALQTRSQFVAYIAVNSLTKQKARTLAVASDMEKKTEAEWRASFLKEKPNLLQTMHMISNAQDVVMTTMVNLRNEEIIRANADRAKQQEELTNHRRALQRIVEEMSSDRQESAAKISALEKERDEALANLAELQEMASDLQAAEEFFEIISKK
jgi:hypothetical protein